MTLHGLWAFLAVSLLVIATPGPDAALAVRNTLIDGRRGGCFSAIGVATGQAIRAFGTSLGLVALLLASEGVFEAVRWLGAAYLIHLGVTFLWRAWRGGANCFIPDVAARQLAPMAAFREGALSDLGNPKMAVFFSSLLPQFADGFTGLALHGLLFAGLTLAWLAGDAVVLSRPGNLIRRPSIWRAVEAVTGAALVALGLRLASGSH